MKHSKIGIIGAGNVGSTIAFTLMLKNVAAEIRLLDVNKQRSLGEVLDLSDSLGFGETSCVKATNVQEIGESDIIIITAGIRQKPEQTRLELLKMNAQIMNQIASDLKDHLNPQAIIIVVTNPVDILTLQIKRMFDLSPQQIIGSGTYLDVQRLKLLLCQKFNVSFDSIYTFVLGEHGDTQFVAWSLTEIGGKPIKNLENVNQKMLDYFALKVKEKANEIITLKGSTSYGIASCVTSICQSIIFNQKKIIPVSCYDRESDVCLSMPCIIGESGIEKRFSISLDDNEIENLEKSIETLKKLATELN